MSLSSDLLLFFLHIISSLPAIIAILIAGILTFLNHYTAPKYSRLEPPPLPHLLPFFGHALSFVRDQRAFFERANKTANGLPFSMLVAGDKLYIFHRPDHVSLLFRKSAVLTETRADQRNFRINLLGFSARDADKVAGLRYHERQIHAAHLLAAEPLAQTLAGYFEELDIQLDRIGDEVGRVVDGSGLKRIGFELVGDILMRSTVQALFGHDSFADYPDLFKDLRCFLSEHFFERMIGLPNLFARGAVRARERIKKRLKEVVLSIDQREGVSEYIQDQVRKLGKLGLSLEGVVSNEFDIILGANLNSIPITYIAVLRLINSSSSSSSSSSTASASTSTPTLLSCIRTDLDRAHWAMLSPQQRAHLAPAALPHLHALVREVLRYHSTAWSAREVRETTTVELRCPMPTPITTATMTEETMTETSSKVSGKTSSTAKTSAPPAGTTATTTTTARVYELQKGAIVAMPSSLLHHDPATHACPDVFDARRFLVDKHEGQGSTAASVPTMAGSSATLRPFGGGASYCPGRLFAERQVVGFLAGVVSAFDVCAVKGEGEGEGKQVEVPRNADFFYVTGQRAVEVQVRRRE